MKKTITLLKVAFIFSLGAFQLLSSTNVNAQAAWTAKAGIPASGRDQAVAFSIGSKGYIATGYNSGTYYNDCWEYDPVGNTWTQKANFGGTTRYGASGFVIGSKGYITGGYDGGPYRTDLWEFDPSLNTWVAKTDFAGSARMNAASFSIGNYGYIVTGAAPGAATDLWEYDPIGDTWAAKASLPANGRYGAVGFSIGGYGYVTLGTDGGGNYYTDLWEWNQSLDTWSQKANYGGVGRHYLTGFVINNKAYMGTGIGTSYQQDMWEWNPANNTWTQTLNFPGGARFGTSCFSINGKGYMGTGNSSNDLYEYDPCGGFHPTITASGPTTFCIGDSVTLTTSTGTTYSWSNGPSSTNITVATSGNYFVTVTNANGCVANSDTVTVTVNGIPITPITSNDGPHCENSTLNLTANLSLGATYSWTGPNGFTSSSQNPTIVGATINATGSYYLVTSMNGCTSDTSTTMVTINPNPFVTISSTTNVTCNGGSDGSIYASASGSTSPYAYSWSPGGATSSGLTNVAIGTYTVTVTDANGCFSTANNTITEPAPFIVDAIAPSIVCEGLPINFTATSGATFMWTGPSSFNSSLQNPVIANALTSLSGMYYLSATDSLGCSGVDSVYLTVNTFSVSTSGVTTACFKDSLWITAIGANSYTWDHGISNGVKFVTPTPQSEYYYVNSTDVNGCTRIDSVFVTAYALPSVNAGSDQTVCENSTVMLSGPPNTVSWNGPSLNTSTQNPSFTATPASAGSYILVGNDANNCYNSDTLEITVVPSATLSGAVNFAGAPVGGGAVSAYNITSGVFDLAGTANISGAGTFSFSLDPGDYIILAELDTNIYLRAVATYDTSSHTWNGAVPVNLTCGNNANTFVNVIQTPFLNGSGVISGQIFGGNGPLKTWQQGDPIPGVDVSLEQNPGSIMLAQTQTDATGAYSFVNVPVGNYSIYVDVPGLGMSATYDVNISSGNNTFTDAMFYVDSTGTIDTVRAIISGNKGVLMYSNNVSIYPNPYNTFTNINYELSEKATVNIEVYNVLGEKIATLVNTTKEAGKYNERFGAKNFGAGAGIYFVRININDKVQTVRLVETN